jgi:N-acetyl-gamma-glutamyl-phosphate reductase
MASVFIDGQAGTTGLEIFERLSARRDLQLLEIDPQRRKDVGARQDLLQSADVAILCLPDDAAREAVALTDGKSRILDASTAYRVADDWVYGLPELNNEQPEKLAAAQFVSNPGCYPQGFILLTRPLIDAGILSPDTPLRCHAISGYSGGGRQMVERFRAFDAATAEALNSQDYALNLAHKHVPEMQRYSGTAVRPIFTPMVANYYKGMLVHVPLFREQELGGTAPADIHQILADRYAGEPFVQVMPYGGTDMLEGGYLNPTALNDSNDMQLMVFGNDEQLLLVARYDNLGKGASGAAVQNLNIMLGMEPQAGL